MDEKYYEERVSSILRGREGYDEKYSSISEFKEHLNEAGLAEEELGVAWVMWRENEQQQLHHKIKTLLKHLRYECFWFGIQSLVQFWGVVKEEGRHHYLSTSHYPFFFDYSLRKGVSWYRKICMDRGAVEAEQLGGVERAYRNKQPESTPDLRLYSTDEFPLRDEAARCGFTAYMALPLFDLHTHESYGVLEILSDSPYILDHSKLELDPGLQIAGLKSTHIRKDTHDRYEQPDNEITEILELAIKADLGLSLAQVWIPCKQCPNTSTTLRCMEMASFISAKNKIVSSKLEDAGDMLIYLGACKFHNLQIDLTCFHRNMSDLSITQSPLAHHAKKARLSHCFAFCLQNVNNSNDPFVIIQFFLPLNNREDACGDSSLHLLLRIIETKLKSFELVRIEQQPNIAIECESIDMFNVMKSFKENFSELDFTTYLETSCSLPPFSEKVGDRGWVFCSLVGENLIDNDVQDNLLNVLSLPKYKIQQFMKKIVVKLSGEYWIIQFWTPKMVEDRYRLETIDQPYALSSLAKGLASFRKECTKHHYFVDDEAKEEELGPPGRVFRNKHREFSPSLFLYSTKEFGMRNYAVHCHLEEYFALPVFDKQVHKCVGVLEFIGIEYDKQFAKYIKETLKVANLSTSCVVDLRPRFKANHIPTDIAKALTEVESAFSLIGKIPQLYLAKVWVPYKKCANMNSNVRYMKLALTTEFLWEEIYTNQVHWISRVQSKKGMIGMVLESENKSCFCRSLSEFSIADQPLALVEREKRLDVCFAICLQSSHTGDLLYVLEFFLNPSINDLPSFFNFLLPIFKQELQSFNYSSGKQIGEELVVEVIEFCEANNAFSELGQLDVFPIKFKRVQYGQTENQQAEDESLHCVSNVMQTEQCNTTTSNFKKTNRGKRKINLHLSLEDLKPHFGKKLKDVAQELGVGRSTIKRACREYGIDRWPANEKQARNPSLFVKKSPDQDMAPSSSRSLQLQDTSLYQNVPPTTKTESTQHQILYSQDTSKDKKGSFPAKLQLLKKDEYDDDNDDIVQIIDANNALLGKAVALTTDSTNAIVAYGTVIGHNKKSNLLHGQPFPKDCTRVSIDKVVNANASLPIPIPNECNNVGDTIGTHVAWPNHFVMALNKGSREKNNVQKAVAKERMVRCYASLPGPLKMICSYAEHDLNDGRYILIALDNDVFGDKCSIYVHLEDIIPFCDLEPISGTCIVVYIWHLYNKIKQENTIGRFQFVNPFDISYVSNVQPPTIRAYKLADRLITVSQNQLVLVPCNIGHWILTVIQPYEEVVSVLNPLNDCICDKWEHVVNIAMSVFNANLKKIITKNPTWKIIKAPRQPDDKQCGYYVMRYMKEIVEGLNTIDSSSLSSLFVREEYSQIDINEVRVEWAHRLQEHV